MARLSNPDLRTVWHPSPEAGTVNRERGGNLLVLVGDVHGQLHSGEFVSL